MPPIDVEINLGPQEVGDPPPFDQDYANCSYDASSAHRFWRVLISSSKVMERFRGKVLGTCSPVHFFRAVSTWRVRVIPGGSRRRARA
jgi:hypothetical protein